MTEQTVHMAGRTLSLLAEGTPRALVYIPLSAEDAHDVWQRLTPPRPALIALDGIDWNRDLSPWPAPAAFRRGGDFAGEGGAFLQELTETILPKAERLLGIAAPCRVLAGYSLAGLFAVWALYQTDLFSRAASVSGSLWFDGFAAYAADHPLAGRVEKVCFSLGDREKRAREPRMACVEDCTRQVQSAFDAAGVPTAWRLDPGGHFADVPARIARSIDEVCG